MVKEKDVVNDDNLNSSPATSFNLAQWADRAAGEDLHLPVTNVFIPTDLFLKIVSEEMKLPVLSRKTPYSRLWYKPDTTFSTPKAYVKIDVNCPFSGTSPESEVLTKIYTRLLMDYLNEYVTLTHTMLRLLV